MIQSRLLGPQILTSRSATALVISAVLAAASAWALGETPGPTSTPKLSEAERARLLLEERNQLRAEVIKLAKADKLDEVLAAEVKMPFLHSGVALAEAARKIEDPEPCELAVCPTATTAS